MNQHQLCNRTRVTVATLAMLAFLHASAPAQETNTLEMIQRLQKRIDELEQKVKTLESSPPPSRRMRQVTLDKATKRL